MRATLFGILLTFFGMLPVIGQDMQFYAQAAQDQMVDILLYKMLGKQDRGYYLEIGAYDPIQINNTYYFEKNYGWEGVSIDISPAFQSAWELTRHNPLLIQDALETDYDQLLKPYPFLLDYLSLDIDNDYDVVLKRIPFDRHAFKIITIEHDAYAFGDKFQKREREILSKLGYYLLCVDVSNTNLPYEDWWIYPKAFPADLFTKLTALDLKSKNYGDVIQTLRSALNN
jgi:hypothetical protein